MSRNKDSQGLASAVNFGVAMVVLCLGMLCLVGGAEMPETEPVPSKSKAGLSRSAITVLVCLSLVAVCIVCWIVSLIHSERDETINAGTIVVEERGSLAWVDAFTKRDFSLCDQLIGGQDSRFYSPLVLTLSRDKRYYERALNGVVDCIVDVGLVSAEDGKYKFKVRYKEYEPCLFDVNDLTPLRGSYMSGNLSDQAFSSELSNFYFDVFSESCFRLGEDVNEFTFVFTELEHDGVKYVSGSVEFVDLLFELSGLSANFVSYEDTVKVDIDSVLKLGFEDG